MSRIRVGIVGIGAWARGVAGWAAPAVSSDDVNVVATARPSPALLPPVERRRAPDGVAVALQVADEAVTAATTTAGIDRATLASVFASAHGDLAIVDYLCTTLATDPASLSPTRFHLSVHNAASGYWSIAAADRAPSTAIAAGEFTVAAGLLEAATMAVAEARPVLVVFFDTPAVGLLARAVDNDALFGFALVMVPAADTGDFELTLVVRPGTAPDAPVGLASSSPAAQGSLVAGALAAGSGTVILPLAPDLALSITVADGSNAHRLPGGIE